MVLRPKNVLTSLVEYIIWYFICSNYKNTQTHTHLQPASEANWEGTCGGVGDHTKAPSSLTQG